METEILAKYPDVVNKSYSKEFQQFLQSNPHASEILKQSDNADIKLL